MVVTYTAHFCRCPSLFLHRVPVGRLLPKTVERLKEHTIHLFPTAQEVLHMRYKANLILLTWPFSSPHWTEKLKCTCVRIVHCGVALVCQSFVTARTATPWICCWLLWLAWIVRLAKEPLRAGRLDRQLLCRGSASLPVAFSGRCRVVQKRTWVLEAAKRLVAALLPAYTTYHINHRVRFARHQYFRMCTIEHLCCPLINHLNLLCSTW